MRIQFHKITAGPFQENGYLIHGENDKKCFIIDPGDSPQLYIQKIEDNGLTPIAILNTHGHIDHVHAVQPLKDHYKIPFYISKNDEFIIDHYPQGCLMYGIAPNKKPVIDYRIGSENELIVGGYNIQLIHTPGHTPGGICYQFNGDIFTGDTVFKGSIGRTDFPGGDYNALMDSLKKLINEVPGNTKVHSGHGFCTTMENEVDSNPFLANTVM